jgi:DNA repair exonuclease SbcCD ATPase subunit
MSDNEIDFGDIFGSEAAVAEQDNTSSAQEAQQELQQNLESFEKQFDEAKTSLEENPIHKIISSGKTWSETQQDIIDFALTEIGEGSEAVIEELSQISQQYAALSTMTSETVRQATNLDRAAVFTTTMQKMADNQNEYSEKAGMFNKAIAALQDVQKQGKDIKDVIQEAKGKRKKFSELKNSMLLQSEAVEDAQGEYDKLISKQKGLQTIVDEAMQQKADYTNGREEVKDEQGEVTQKKLPSLEALKAAHEAEKGGMFGFGGKRKQELADFVKEYEGIIKAAYEELDDTNIQVKNLEPQIKRAEAKLNEVKSELESQTTEHDAIQDHLKNDAIICAVEKVIGEDDQHFVDQAKAFQGSGTELIQLMKTDFASCVDFYTEQQKNVGKLINVGGNLGSELELIISGLRKAETAHEKRYSKLSKKLEDALSTIEEEKQQAVTQAETIENEEERGEKLAEIDKEYMDNPPLIQKMIDDQSAYQDFVRNFSSRLEQIISFEQNVVVALETSKITQTNAADLAREAESLKNEQIMTVSNSTTNATETVAQLMMELRMNVIRAFGTAANKDNTVLIKQGVDTMVHRKVQALKQGKEKVLNLNEVTTSMDKASAQLKSAAEHSVALDKITTASVKRLAESAQGLANTTKTSEEEVNAKMKSDPDYAKTVAQKGKDMFAQKPAAPSV